MTDQPDTSQPDEQTSHEHPPVADDDGAALERAAESIKEAEAAEGDVASNDDITVLDEQRAGAYSEDPDGSGGHP